MDSSSPASPAGRLAWQLHPTGRVAQPKQEAGLEPAPQPDNAAEFARMKARATALLVGMAALFLAARAFEHVHPAIGFVKAFAEAAMVGGLADWFAVTALFRHPLGIPIPHTAIVPRNKDRIGETLARFLRTNFLTPAVVARRMRALDVAGAAGRFLSDPDHGGAGRLRDGASRLLADLLESLDDQRLGGMVKTAIGDKLRELNAAPLLGQALEAAMREDRHIPLLDGILNRASLILASNEQMIRDMVHERSGRILRWTGLDEDVANAIISGLNKLFYDLADDPGHPLRLKVDDALADVARRLQTDPKMQERVAVMKDEIIENPAMQKWIGGLWDQGRAALLKGARDPERAMAGRFGDMFRQLGGTLQSDSDLKNTINRFVRRTTVGATASYGDSIVRLVSDTIRGWDAQKLTDRVEVTVGRDLQFIRINGTLVGGLVGLLIHTVDVLL
jgi:uncharacterized membrane-anchored protein YjiN (DUF445 family)